MENWVFLFLGLILGIPLSIFANYATPYVVNYLKNRSLSSRQRKMNILFGEYDWIKSFSDNHMSLMLWSIRNFFIAVLGLTSIGIWIFLLSLTVVSSILRDRFQYQEYIWFIFTFISGFLFGFPVRVLQHTISTINKIIEFSNYRENTVKKVIKLGGNPEDLDKETE